MNKPIYYDLNDIETFDVMVRRAKLLAMRPYHLAMQDKLDNLDVMSFFGESNSDGKRIVEFQDCEQAIKKLAEAIKPD